MSQAELALLDHDLSQGPYLVRDAVFGACVGAVVGWLGDVNGKRLFSSIAQGAMAGAGVSLASYAFGSWKSSSEHKQLESSHHAGGLALYPGWPSVPFYDPSVTYPWSNH